MSSITTLEAKPVNIPTLERVYTNIRRLESNFEKCISNYNGTEGITAEAKNHLKISNSTEAKKKDNVLFSSFSLDSNGTGPS